MAALGKAVLVVEGDYSGLQRDTEAQVKGPMASLFGSGFGKIAAVAGTALAGAGLAKGIDLLKSSIGAASDLGEAVNVTGLVFGDQAKAMDGFFAASATNLGMAESAARTGAANIGSLLGNLGFGAKDAADATEGLLSRAADLGSAFNAEPEEVVGALGAALRGETEPARRFGIMLDDAAIKAEAMAMGLYSGTGAIDKNAKAQAAMSLIMKQSDKVQGDFANTSDGVANGQRQLAAMWEDMQAQLGTALLPAISEVMKVFKDLMPVVQPLIAVLGKALGAALTALVPVVEELVKAFVPMIDQMVRQLAPFLPDLAKAFAGLIVALAPLLPPLVKLSTATLPVTITLFNALSPLLIIVADLLTKILVPVLNLVAGLQGALVPAVKAVVGVFQNLPGALSAAVSFLSGLPGQIVGFFRNLPNELASIGRNMISSLASAINGAVGSVLSAARNVAEQIPGQMRSLANVLFDVGWDMIAGLGRGIRNAASSIVSSALDFVKGLIPSWARSALGIHSPSTLFAGYGAATMQGFAQGIKQNAGLPIAALDRVAATLSLRSPGTLVAAGAGLAGVAGLAGAGGTSVVVNAQTDANPYQIANELSWVLWQAAA